MKATRRLSLVSTFCRLCPAASKAPALLVTVTTEAAAALLVPAAATAPASAASLVAAAAAAAPAAVTAIFATFFVKPFRPAAVTARTLTQVFTVPVTASSAAILAVLAVVAAALPCAILVATSAAAVPVARRHSAPRAAGDLASFRPPLHRARASPPRRRGDA